MPAIAFTCLVDGSVACLGSVNLQGSCALDFWHFLWHIYILNYPSTLPSPEAHYNRVKVPLIFAFDPWLSGGDVMYEQTYGNVIPLCRFESSLIPYTLWSE